MRKHYTKHSQTGAWCAHERIARVQIYLRRSSIFHAMSHYSHLCTLTHKTHKPGALSPAPFSNHTAIPAIHGKPYSGPVGEDLLTTQYQSSSLGPGASFVRIQQRERNVWLGCQNGVNYCYSTFFSRRFLVSRRLLNLRAQHALGPPTDQPGHCQSRRIISFGIMFPLSAFGRKNCSRRWCGLWEFGFGYTIGQNIWSEDKLLIASITRFICKLTLIIHVKTQYSK